MLLSALGAVAKKDPPDPLSTKGFLQIARGLAAELVDATKDADTRALRDAFDALSVNWSRLSPSKQAKAIADAETFIAHAGAQVIDPLSTLLKEHGDRVVASTKGAMIGRYELPITGTLGKLDRTVIDHAVRSQALFVTDQYGQRAASASEHARLIVAEGMKEGVGDQAIGTDLYTMLGQQLGRSPAYFANAASIFTARARSFAQLASMDEAGIEEYEISAVLDEVTCFWPGTPVLMANGHTKPIETITAGERVMSCKGRARRVLRALENKGRRWGLLTIAGAAAPLRVTMSHGILTARGWMRASSLVLGDRVALYRASGPGAASTLWCDDERVWGQRRGRHDSRTIAVGPWPSPLLERIGHFGELSSIEWSAVGGRDPAFDLEVEDDAGYVAAGIIVHNSPICRMLDGQRFSTGTSLARFAKVAESPPEDVRDLQPFVQQGKDDAGNTVLYYKSGGERTTIAQVEESGVGRKDDRGKFSKVSSRADLEGAGLGAPPYHGHCRSLIVPVFEGVPGT